MKTMRAIQCLRFGQPASLELRAVPCPDMIVGGVRVRTEYCGLGFPDALMLQGRYQTKHVPPFVPGSEIAGIVTEVAEGVDYPRVGSRVVGLDQSFAGGLAEETVAAASCLLELPDFVSTRVAAGMAVNYATARYGLVQRAGFKAGETALVLGAGGNLGIAFIEMLAAHGIRPLAACGSKRKLDTALNHGAVMGFNYRDEPIGTAVDRMTDGAGLDLVIDPVGGDYTKAALKCLKPGGRLIVVGFAGGEIPCMPLNLPLLKNCSIVGVLLSTQVAGSPAEFRHNLASVFELFREDRLRPELTEVDCFTDFSCGLELLGDREHIGKIVMRIGGRA